MRKLKFLNWVYYAYPETTDISLNDKFFEILRGTLSETWTTKLDPLNLVLTVYKNSGTDYKLRLRIECSHDKGTAFLYNEEIPTEYSDIALKMAITMFKNYLFRELLELREENVYMGI